MTDERMVEELARIDGWVNIEFDMLGAPMGVPPSYLNSHDAVQRVIDKLSDDHLLDYSELLSFVMGFKFITWRDHKATPRQKCEAILKAVGKWEESPDGDRGEEDSE